MQGGRVGAGFYGQLAVIGILTYLVHEGAHWLAGTALGYPVVFGLNNVISPVPMTAPDRMMMSIAGPAVTILGALVAFLWTRRTPNMTAYAIIYFAFFMRLAAAGVSVFNPNDEARVSAELGWGTWTLPIIVVVSLAVLTLIASRALRLTWKVHLGAYLVASLVVTAMVGMDMMLRA